MTDIFTDTTTDPAMTQLPDPMEGPGAPKSLRERIEQDYAPAWRPNEGDTIVGFLQEISVGTSDYGAYPIITVISDADSERYSIHAFHSTLKTELVNAKPSIGEEIAVKYNGLRVPKAEMDEGKVTARAEKKFGTKDDPRYHDYRVIVNRAPADVWGQFGQAPQA